MLLDTKQTDVVGSGDVETEDFRILASAKTFMVLSSQLYKYKIRAIIREICCNAVDGHSAAERAGLSVPKQFDVHLPNALDPEFRCRDYGIGLSHEDVMTMYSTYFASTKSGSNDAIGGFGLGCKSPFCYSDTFSVTSWFGGRKRMYAAYMHDGKPKMSLLSDIEQGDEPCGVEVSIPTQGNDFNEWAKEAKYVFFTFDIDGYTPKMTGFDPVIRYISSYDASGVSIGSNVHDRNGVYAVMGGVAYPIPREFITGTYLTVYNEPVFIKFQIGELDIQPSREELSLDNDTKESITKRIKEVCDYRMADVYKVADQCKDIRELYSAVRRFPSIVWDDILRPYVIDGKTVRDWCNELGGMYNAPHLDAGVYSLNMSSDMSIRRSVVNRTKADRCGNRFNYAADLTRKMPYVIFNDLKTGYGDVVRGLHSLNYINALRGNVYIVNTYDDSEEKQLKNMKYFLSLWPQRLKAGKIFTLSKWKDRVKAELDAKGIVIGSPKKRTSKPVTVEIYEYDDKDGDVNQRTIRMMSADIENLTTGYWIVGGRDYLYPAKATTKTVVKKDGTAVEKFDRMVEDVGCIRSRSVLSNYVRMTKSTLYICKLNQSHYFERNKNIVCVYDKVIEKAKELIYSLTMTDLPAPSIPRFVHRLFGNKKTEHIAKVLTSGSGSAHDVTSFIDSFIEHYRVTDTNRDDFVEMRNHYMKLRDDALDVASSRYIKFKKENPMIYKYLDTCYNITDDVAEDITSFVRM